MANSTLLQLVDAAWNEMGLGTAPTSVISNTDTAVIQFLNLLNGLGNDLVKEHEWQGLTKEYRFTTVFYSYTATTTTASTTISAMSSTTGLTANPTYFMVTGPGIQQDTYLVSVNGGASTAVLSQAATASATVTLTFSQVMYALPSDYDRLIDDTEWDKNQHWPLIGPVRSQGWQWLKSGYIATGSRARFRVLNSLFQVWPPLGAADYMGFEYVSNQWVAATGAALSKSSFTVDTDTCIFPDRLIVESLKLRFAKGGGFEWLMKFFTPYELNIGIVSRLLSLAKSQEAGSPVLSMAPRAGNTLISENNVQDGNYNV